MYVMPKHTFLRKERQLTELQAVACQCLPIAQSGR
jgi:hypothetical protein